MTAIELLDPTGTPVNFLLSGKPGIIRMHFYAEAEMEDVIFGLGFFNGGRQRLRAELRSARVAHHHTGRGAYRLRHAGGAAGRRVPTVSTAVVSYGDFVDYLDRNFEMRVRSGTSDEPGMMLFPGTWTEPFTVPGGSPATDGSYTICAPDRIGRDFAASLPQTPSRSAAAHEPSGRGRPHDRGDEPRQRDGQGHPHPAGRGAAEAGRRRGAGGRGARPELRAALAWCCAAARLRPRLPCASATSTAAAVRAQSRRHRCYRAAFYLGDDWESYTHNPLFARFSANKAGQPFDKVDPLLRRLPQTARAVRGPTGEGAGDRRLPRRRLDQLRSYLGPQAELIGIDIGEESAAVCADRFEVLIGDQTDTDFLARVAAERGPFDVVIDDGGHSMRQQITAIEHLFASVREGGIYIVEDTHTSHWEPYHDADQTFMEWVKDRVDDINAYHVAREADLSQWTTQVAAIHVFDSIVAFDRRRHLPPFCEVVGTGSFVRGDRISESMLLAYRGALAGAEARTELYRADRRLVDEDRQRVAAARDEALAERDDAVRDRERAVRERDRVMNELQAARAQIAEAERDLQVISESASWKMTEPLRRLRPPKKDG